MLELAGDGLIHGPAHSSIGQEGGAVGSVLALTQRRHRQRLAPRPPPVPGQGARPRRRPKGSTRREPSPTTSATVLLRTLAEICGLDRGFCHGRGGSMHLQWQRGRRDGHQRDRRRRRAAGRRASRWAHQQAGTDAVAVTYFGDGAVNIGSTLETFNLAAAWKLPRLLLHREQPVRRVDHGRTRPPASPGCRRAGPGFGIRQLEGRRHGPAGRAPGHAGGARAHARRAAARPSSRPTSTATSTRTAPFPGSAFGYRTKEEEQAWRAARPARPARAATWSAAGSSTEADDRRRDRQRPRR